MARWRDSTCGPPTQVTRLREALPWAVASTTYMIFVGRVSTAASSVMAGQVGIGPNRHRGFGLAVALSVSLPVLGPDVAARLVDAAHEVCPYSNATRGNIDVTILLG